MDAPPPLPPPLPPVLLGLVEDAVRDLRDTMPSGSGMTATSAAPVYLLAVGQLLAEAVGPGPARSLMRAAAERLPYDCLQRLDVEIARREGGPHGAASC